MENEEQPKDENQPKIEVKQGALVGDPQHSVNTWQKVLFGVGLFCTLAVFVVFVVTTIMQVDEVQKSITQSPTLKDSLIYNLMTKTSPESKDNMIDISLLMLENQTIQKRYHNANMILKSQIYTRYLGFLAGMILSILGAMFILGKFREDPTDAKFESGEESKLSLQLKSSSPGILLTFIGSLTMMVAMLNRTEVEVTDGAIYIQAAFPERKTSKVDTTKLLTPPGVMDKLKEKTDKKNENK